MSTFVTYPLPVPLLLFFVDEVLLGLKSCIIIFIIFSIFSQRLFISCLFQDSNTSKSILSSSVFGAIFVILSLFKYSSIISLLSSFPECFM